MQYVEHITWDDVPHLTSAAKAELTRGILPYQLEARTRGVPHIGTGAIYAIPDSEVEIAPFEIPRHWKRCAAADCGWNFTAAVWAAIDAQNDVVYLYADYKRAMADTATHAMAMRAKGLWIPFVADAADVRGDDGRSYINIYREDHAFDMVLPDKSVETGLEETWLRLTSGRLKVFTTCKAWFQEKRLYRRDKRGKIVKVNDHLMDATRYLVRSGLARAVTAPTVATTTVDPRPDAPHDKLGWMR